MCDACESESRTISRRSIIQVAGVNGGLLATVGLSHYHGLVARAADDATPEPEDLDDPEAFEDPHWGYEGEEGPENWGELNPEYATCSGGTEQSPIDVSAAASVELPDIAFDYQVISPFLIINNGHTIEVEATQGSTITLDGKVYELSQFHFHTPSEHTIDGQGQAMELHLVNIAEDGEIAVVGVLLGEGDENAAYQPIFAALPVEPDTEHEVAGSVDPNALLPESRTTYRYAGSLTTPPCTEGVHWLLMTEPVALSAEQIAAYRAVFAMDARPVQPLNDREVEEDTAA